MKIKKLGLLPLIIISIIVGIALGNVLPLGVVRVFTTFNALFSQFLGFMVPLIIVGLVTPAIADVGKRSQEVAFNHRVVGLLRHRFCRDCSLIALVRGSFRA